MVALLWLPRIWEHEYLFYQTIRLGRGFALFSPWRKELEDAAWE